MQAATSIDLDPAAIGQGTNSYAYAAAVAVLDQYGIKLAPGDALRDNELSAGGMVAGVFHVGDRATLAAEFRSAPPETFVANRDALAYHTLGGGQRSYRFGVGASIRILNELYFGLSLSIFDATYLHLHYARDSALDAGHGPNGIDSDCDGSPCGIGNPAAQEHYDVNVNTSLFSTSNLVLNLGVLVELSHDVWLGVAYHAPPGLQVQSELGGTMDVLRAPRDGATLMHGAASVFLSQPASADAELRARLPAKLDLHVGARWEDLSRLAGYDVRGYGSTFAAAGIPEWQLRARGLHDPFSLWAGVEQVEVERDKDRVLFGARIGIETSSLRDSETTPLSIAPFSYTADVGAQLRLFDRFRIQATYGIQYFPKVTVTDSAFDPNARIDCIASNYDYASASCTAVRNGYGIASADGTYDRIEHAARIALIIDL
jgi:hypothetical protein